MRQFGEHWTIHVIGACGHLLMRYVPGVLADGHVPHYIQTSWPIGKRKRCPACPSPEAKPEVPEAQRCAYDSVGGEEVGWRRCATRAAWLLWTRLGTDGSRVAHTWPQVCERHRRVLEASGHYSPDEDDYAERITRGVGADG